VTTILAGWLEFDVWHWRTVPVTLELSGSMALTWAGCLTLVWLGDDVITRIPHMVKRLAGDSARNNACRSSYKVPVIACQINNWMCWRFWVKPPNIKFHENPFDGSRLVKCGQIGRIVATLSCKRA
jgi:hypothetical protein